MHMFHAASSDTLATDWCGLLGHCYGSHSTPRRVWRGVSDLVSRHALSASGGHAPHARALPAPHRGHLRPAPLRRRCGCAPCGTCYTCYTHAIHMLYTCYTHAIHMLYTCYTHAIHMPYTCHTHARVHTCHTYASTRKYTQTHLSYTQIRRGDHPVRGHTGAGSVPLWRLDLSGHRPAVGRRRMFEATPEPHPTSPPRTPLPAIPRGSRTAVEAHSLA